MDENFSFYIDNKKHPPNISQQSKHEQPNKPNLFPHPFLLKENDNCIQEKTNQKQT